MTEHGDIDALFLSFCLSDSDIRSPQLAGAVLGHPELRAFVAARQHDAEARPHLMRLGRADAMRQVVAGTDWTPTAVAWLVELDASWPESAEFCAKLCRKARELGNTGRMHLHLERVLGHDLTGVEGRAWLHLYLNALRYEFRCAALEHSVESLPVPLATLDPYVHALYAYALLGQNKPDGLHELQAVLARGVGDDRSILHALTDGLRFAERVHDRADVLLDLLRQPPFSGQRDATLLFREAAALQMLGRYDEALNALDRSINQLQPGDVDRLDRRLGMRRRILEERHLTGRIQQEYAQARDEARREVDQTSHRLMEQLDDALGEVHRQLSDSAIRVVEILGIFTAIIALIVGGAASALTGELRWWERALLILTSGTVAIGFFVLLRFVVWSGSGTRRRSAQYPTRPPAQSAVSRAGSTNDRESRT